MDELDLFLQYIEDTKNVLVNCFSLPIMDQSVTVGVGNGNMNNKNNQTGTPVNFHTIKVSRDGTFIDDESFFNVEEMYKKDNRIHKDGDYFNVEEDNTIFDLFLNLSQMGEMYNPINNHFQSSTTGYRTFATIS